MSKKPQSKTSIPSKRAIKRVYAQTRRANQAMGVPKGHGINMATGETYPLKSKHAPNLDSLVYGTPEYRKAAAKARANEKRKVKREFDRQAARVKKAFETNDGIKLSEPQTLVSSCLHNVPYDPNLLTFCSIDWRMVFETANGKHGNFPGVIREASAAQVAYLKRARELAEKAKV